MKGKFMDNELIQAVVNEIPKAAPILTATAGLRLLFPDLVKPTEQQLGKLAGDLFTVVAFPVTFPIELLKTRAEKVKQMVIEGVIKRMEKVSEENRKAPDIEIAFPLLRSLNDVADNDTLREMYLNLLSSAMDCSKDKSTHRSYVDVINNLSPEEAWLLAEFRPKTGTCITMSTKMYENGKLVSESKSPEKVEPSYYTFPETIKPMISYWLTNKGNRLLIHNNVVKTDISDDVDLISASVANLLRLGLIEINYTMQLDSKSYDYFLNNRFYRDWADFNENRENQAMWRYVRGNRVAPKQYERMDIEKGMARLTQFGYNFISSCVIEEEVVRGI